jgi:hypothetical protein
MTFGEVFGVRSQAFRVAPKLAWFGPAQLKCAKFHDGSGQIARLNLWTIQRYARNAEVGMAKSYKEALATAPRVFVLLIIILTNESLRAQSKAQLLDIIKTAKASNPAELGEIVRQALIDMAEQSYKNGINLGHVDGIIARIQQEKHL